MSENQGSEAPPQNEVSDRSTVLPGDLYLRVILVAALVLGLIYNAVLIVGKAPDELRHMAYIQLLFEERSLPRLLADGSEYRGAHSLHPPLYYAILLPLYALGRAAGGDATWHLTRLGSLIMCLAALPLLYVTACRVSDRAIARGAVTLLALLPVFGMTSGSVNNDASSVLAFAVFLWLLVVKFESRCDLPAALLLGLALGAGSLCKATVVIACAGAVVAYTAGRRSLPAPLSSIGGIAAFCAGAVVLAAPWYLRSFAMYGSFSPIESGYTNPALPAPSYGQLIMLMHPNFPEQSKLAVAGLFDSMWTQIDWIPPQIQAVTFRILAIITLASGVGHLLALRSRPGAKRGEDLRTASDPQSVHSRACRFAIYGAFVLLWIACWYMALFKHWGWHQGGRYLLAAVFGATLFLSAGISGLLRERNHRAQLFLWWLLGLTLNAMCVYWLVSYLNPTFGSA